MHPKSAHESFWWLRISIFAFWAVYGVVPIAHFTYLHGGWTMGIVAPFIQRITVKYGIFTAAFVVYFFKIPGTGFTNVVNTLFA
jgi:hypothetical protein